MDDLSETLARIVEDNREQRTAAHSRSSRLLDALVTGDGYSEVVAEIFEEQFGGEEGQKESV